MNRIENELTGPRMSTNVSVPRQTPNTEFGARVQAGVNATADVVSSAGSLATGMFAGRGIVSAAVSSLGTFSNASSSGAVTSSGGMGSVSAGLPSGGLIGASSTPYTSLSGGGGDAMGAGVLGVPGTGTTSVDTTVPGTTLGGTGVSYYPSTGTSQTQGQYNGEMAGMFDEQKRMLSLQIAMQRENQIFTTVSNVLKTRHDTAKNAISNIR